MRKDYEDALNTVICTMGLEATETIVFCETLENFPDLSSEDFADLVRISITPLEDLLEEIED
jgi:pyoverdine/dityrosine biosynthesis protein Dit1